LARKPAWRSWERAGICAVLVILVLMVFGQTVRHGFLNFDDNQYVYENPSVTKGITLDNIGWAFTHVHAANWHPLTTMSHMLDCQFYGLWAGGHHLTNVLLHAAAAVLLFLMLLEMTGALWRSGFVAAVFAIHPLRVESVAWVAERKDVLSGVFFMLTLWAYARYARRPESWGRYALMLLWFILGLISKPMLVTLPFVLLLLDYWPLGRLQQKSQVLRLLREKLPLFALSVLSCVATVIAQKGAIQPLENLPFLPRLGNALVAYAVYLGHLIYPAKLAVFYPIPKQGWAAWQLVAAILILGALTAWVFRLWRQRPYLVVGWLWYLGMLVPVIGILQVGGQAYADRYTYLPQIGLCLAATWAAADWVGKWWPRRAVRRGMAVMLLSVLLVAAHHQASYWRDSKTLWTRTLGCTQDNAVGQNNLGNLLIDEGRTEEAIARYQEAIRIDPVYTNAHSNLGNSLVLQGRIDEAIVQYHLALQIDPAYSMAHNNLAHALLQQGRTEEAIAQYREALRINPASAEVHYNLGNAFLHQRQTEEAIAAYRESLRINPASAMARNNLAAVLSQSGRTEEAIVHFREALQLDPASTDARNNLDVALLQQEKTEKALAQYREAVRIRPDDAQAQYDLGLALFQQRQTKEAIARMQKALELQPDHANAQNSLAWMLATAPQASLRNGARAVQLATQASGGNDPIVLDTLAAAYAEAGDFSAAVQTAKKALQLAEAQSNAALAAALRRELQLYEAGQSFREGP